MTDERDYHYIADDLGFDRDDISTSAQPEEDDWATTAAADDAERILWEADMNRRIGDG